MTTRQMIVVVLVAVTAGAGAFAATRAMRGPGARSGATSSPAQAVAADPTRPLMDWLNVPQDKRREVAAHDPGFAADLQKLRSELASRRTALADALADPKSPDELIRGRVEAVIAASGELERRVTRYLLEVRPYLTAEQQKKLFGLCAEEVRRGNGWRWREGQEGGGPGRGGGMGRGGPRYRGGQ